MILTGFRFRSNFMYGGREVVYLKDDLAVHETEPTDMHNFRWECDELDWDYMRRFHGAAAAEEAEWKIWRFFWDDVEHLLAEIQAE